LKLAGYGQVEDYAVLGVPEYWIVGYLGINRRFIMKAKQPTVFILFEDEYQNDCSRSDESAHFFNFQTPTNS